jgi:ribosomal protein S18 acetylase RimI-like enzyme
MDVIYRRYKKTDQKELEKMIQDFYAEERRKMITDCHTSKSNIGKTLLEVEKHPDKVQVYVFGAEKKLVGYSIIVDYWSHEFGGNVSSIDELFVENDFRGKGIASEFLRYLEDQVRKKSVSLSLEVSPKNEKAKKLYEDWGFSPEGYEFWGRRIRKS